MLGELEDQMATILWQVPQQMFAAVRAAIYITVKHRHANICKRTVSPFFFQSQSGQLYKQMGLNTLRFWYLNFISSKKTKKTYCSAGKNKKCAKQSWE